MRNHRMPPLEKLGRLEPFLNIATGLIVCLGILGGWAGSTWPWVLFIYFLRFPIHLSLGQLKKQGAGTDIATLIIAITNYAATIAIVLLSGGTPNPLWLLFLVETVASAMYRSMQGILFYSLSAFLLLVVLQITLGMDQSNLIIGLILTSLSLLIGLTTYRALAMLYNEYENRKKVEEDLRNSLQEKEVLLKEIHHRVKNNLQVISSLLNLQSQKIVDSASMSAFQESQDRVRSMALIHEKLYQSENLAEIEFSQYINNLCAYLFHSYRSNSADVNLAIDCDPIYLDIDTSVPCGLILNELISNALKHAFPENRSGKIWIEMRMGGNGQVNLTVADNGIGLPHDLNPLSVPSLGLQLVNTLVDQINGEVQFKNSQGTRIEITFQPLHQRRGS